MIIKKITKHHKKLKMTYVASAVIVCLVLTILFPYGNSASASDNYDYAVSLNGEELGTVGSSSAFDEALRNVRLRLNEEAGGIVYLEADVQMSKQDRFFETKLKQEELEEKIYTLLKKSADLTKKQAYIVDIDGFTVTLGSKEEVLELLDRAKDSYDPMDGFEVRLVESSSQTYAGISYEIVKREAERTEEQTIQAASADGIVGLHFEDQVEIIESYVSDNVVSSLDEAFSLVTKDKEENKIYEVVSGDCLSTIASDFGLTVSGLIAMNPGLTEDSIVGIGDRVTVTVPEPELAVIVEEQKTYEESFEAEVSYIDDSTMYQGESVVVSEGSPGYRQVTALVTLRNGEETGREILNQTVLVEPVAKVVQRGTMVRPTYIKPISGGRLSSPFGPRWGTIHKGVDWSCPTGTAVKASCGGKVVSAGWSSGYGNTVLIRHPDGKQTRYGHLSKLLVSAGQSVDQGQIVALSGNTGNSTGPHLHFEIIVNGTQVDPYIYLN